jgi:hypothetical protein
VDEIPMNKGLQGIRKRRAQSHLVPIERFTKYDRLVFGEKDGASNRLKKAVVFAK